jgi:hypothetical protein
MRRRGPVARDPVARGPVARGPVARGPVARRQAVRGWPLALLLVGWLGNACNRDTTVISAPPEARTPAPARSPDVARGVQNAAGAAPEKPAPPPAGTAPVVASPGVAPAVAPGAESFRHSAPGRLIAIGDLHGAIAATRAALRLGGAIDASDRWIGKDLSVVQTGDQLDRGDDEREIVDLFDRLSQTAPAAGGQVIALNGNHEVMNVQGDFRYVTRGAIGDFAGVTPRSPQARGASAPFDDRAEAFFPGGAYARELAERDVVAVVGDSLFVHGGVSPAHVSFGIERINRETREWMLGSRRSAPESVASESSPIWLRDYSIDPVSPEHCQALGVVLSALGVRRMVVGHTVQQNGISSACDDRVYRIDVGLSRYYGEGPIQVLEIDGGKLRVLSAPRAPSAAP